MGRSQNIQMAKTLKDIRGKLAEEQQKLAREHIFSDITIKDVVDAVVSYEEVDHKGWNKVYCQVCGDGSRTQGPRGGWLFENEDCFYNCFNCGIGGAFTPENDIFMSRDMRTIFDAFGIQSRDYGKVLYRLRGSKGKEFIPKIKSREEVDRDKAFQAMVASHMEMPDYLVPLLDVLDKPIGVACKILLEEKCISPDAYPFYVSIGKTSSKDQQNKINAKVMMDRLVIPIFYDKKLLVLQGRDLTGKSKKKYVNIGEISTAVYGLDRLTDSHEQIYVTEGFFDAFHLNGVATITNKLYKNQLDVLNSYDKPKIVVPDRGGDSNALLHKALDIGWGFSAPKALENCKDVTESVKKYGRLFTCYHIQSAKKYGEEAKFLKSLLINHK